MVKIVMAGEVDSGKSTLIGRMLYDTDSISLQAKEEFKKTCRDLGRDLEFAYLLDSFEEERKDEFTLDTTQALLKTKDKEFLLIDVPGHKELIKNMLTGSSYADNAVLVVDVKKSLEEQTKRHLYILNFLGVEITAVAVNKIDAVDYSQNEFEKTKEEIKVSLAGLGIKAAHIIPVSAKRGENLINKPNLFNWYTGPSFIEVLDVLEKGEKDFDFRFPIQDIYDTGKEKIAVGTIASGKVTKKDLLIALPSGVELKLKAIKVFNKRHSSASSGESIGLVVECLPEKIKRGQVLCKGNPPQFLRRIQAKIFCLTAMDINETFILNCSCQEASAKIRAIKENKDTATWQVNENPSSLQTMDAAEVLIETSEALLVEKFSDLPTLGRFVLKKNNQICAIGIIVKI